MVRGVSVGTATGAGASGDWAALCVVFSGAAWAGSVRFRSKITSAACPLVTGFGMRLTKPTGKPKGQSIRRITTSQRAQMNSRGTRFGRTSRKAITTAAAKVDVKVIVSKLWHRFSTSASSFLSSGNI